MKKGIVIVDHGSKREESNKMLEEITMLFHQKFSVKYDIVEPAHMELAEPSISTAYGRCVEKGADFIVICPFFLGPGKHWNQDIPSLAKEASLNFPDTNYHVAKPLGVDDLLLELLEKRLNDCAESEFSCDSCEGTQRAGNL
ncbi:MAG: CbiX/SirB N-terminal domain-containing protein [Thermodesulfobacteriota bacterium]|nr:CbiX/SirB N-terminal domain-containing protein [Thermodesulfobacteriota bacterium]MEE2974947.1 CbiX/SirB N-terminal domain-containing protein [Thermodesulfobacteriota bacterium]|tara:strand:- start:3018 stop:3443 length:426 start_codon:yes stop_codon:yes gene_type:complete